MRLPSKSHPYNQRPSTCIAVSRGIIPCSNDETNFSSSMAIFKARADFYLRAFRKVSGWNKSDKFTAFSSSYLAYIFYSQPSKA